MAWDEKILLGTLFNFLNFLKTEFFLTHVVLANYPSIVLHFKIERSYKTECIYLPKIWHTLRNFPWNLCILLYRRYFLRNIWHSNFAPVVKRKLCISEIRGIAKSTSTWFTIECTPWAKMGLIKYIYLTI